MHSVPRTDSRPNTKTIPTHERVLVSEDAAAALLSVSKPTLRAWVAEGLLTPVELPHGLRRRLYRRTDIEKWAAELSAS